MKKIERVLFIMEHLEQLYPDTPIPLNHNNIYELLIAVLLSAQCTDERVNKVTPKLFKLANTPQDMQKLKTKNIYDIVRPCGLAPKKSLAISNLSKILVEKYNSKRWRVAVGLGFLCWLLGLGTVFSFNIWADLKPVFGLNFFDLVDQISSNILLPLGGLLIAIFIAWRLPRKTVLGQIEIESEPIWTLWKVVTGIVAPASVLVVFLNTFVPFF